MTFTAQDFPGGYVVTGVLYNSTTRFRKTYGPGYQNALFALGINLWRGSVWGIRADKKRIRLKRSVN